MPATAVKPQVRRPARRPLGNLANNSSPGRAEKRRKRRRERHDLRYALRGVTRIGRIMQCGYTGVQSDGAGPGLRLTQGTGGPVAGLSGLATCGSVWACPVCSARIATVRAGDLADVMRYAFRQGCEAAMVTLTMRHHQGQTLGQCWNALMTAWKAVTSGKSWVADRTTMAVRGWVRVVEVTKGEHGWHVHVHVLLIFDQPALPSELRGLADRMWRRWNAALLRNGFDSVRGVGTDIRKASLRPGVSGGLHEYFVKLSHEITGGHAKLARGSGRTPFQILSDALDAGEKADLEAWWEWESVSRGRRQIAWSKGLRQWAGVGAEQTDEEIAGADLEADDMLFIEPASWRAMRHRPGEVCELLEVTEDGGYSAAKRWMIDRGFGFALLARWKQGERT